jgi:hypothetical protein
LVECLADEAQQFFWLIRFTDKVKRAAFDGVDCVFQRVVAREDDDLQLGRLGLQCAENFESAFVRQPDIEQDEVRPDICDALATLRSGRRYVRFEPSASKNRLQNGKRVLVVVNDDDLFGSFTHRMGESSHPPRRSEPFRRGNARREAVETMPRKGCGSGRSGGCEFTAQGIGQFAEAKLDAGLNRAERNAGAGDDFAL